MSLVHTFPLVDELKPGFRIPFQYLGTSESPAARAVEDTMLLAWIQANIVTTSRLSVQTASIATGGTVAVSAEMNLQKIVVIGGASGTFSVGTSASGTDIIDTEAFDTDGEVYVLEQYFHTGATLHFSGFAGSITIKLVLINLAA